MSGDLERNYKLVELLEHSYVEDPELLEGRVKLN